MKTAAVGTRPTTVRLLSLPDGTLALTFLLEEEADEEEAFMLTDETALLLASAITTALAKRHAAVRS